MVYSTNYGHNLGVAVKGIKRTYDMVTILKQYITMFSQKMNVLRKIVTYVRAL
jgi:hypothetical protein